MRFLLAASAALMALMAVPQPAPAAQDAQDPAQYVRSLLDNMIQVSARPTPERRRFYVNMLSNEIDWNTPAMQALGGRFSALSEDDRRKLAEWSRDSVLGHDGVMNFVQNLIFRSCRITGNSRDSARASIRFHCTRAENDPEFIVRFDVEPRGQKYQITDVGYVGISLRNELSKELFKKDAVAQHGVRVDGVAAK